LNVLTAAKISMLVLAVLVAIGGMIGFLKAQSKASLISGVISGGFLATAYSIAGRNAQQGMIFGAVVCAVLCAVFGVRLRKTGKFMPAGMLLILCGIEMIFLCVAIYNATPAIQ
jgi:uncharacterized membrane protein (UPF0136 family)